MHTGTILNRNRDKLPHTGLTMEKEGEEWLRSHVEFEWLSQQVVRTRDPYLGVAVFRARNVGAYVKGRISGSWIIACQKHVGGNRARNKQPQARSRSVLWPAACQFYFTEWSQRTMARSGVCGNRDREVSQLKGSIHFWRFNGSTEKHHRKNRVGLVILRFMGVLCLKQPAT